MDLLMRQELLQVDRIGTSDYDNPGWLVLRARRFGRWVVRAPVGLKDWNDMAVLRYVFINLLQVRPFSI
jgi:hypothetical protein